MAGKSHCAIRQRQSGTLYWNGAQLRTISHARRRYPRARIRRLSEPYDQGMESIDGQDWVHKGSFESIEDTPRYGQIPHRSRAHLADGHY